MFLQPYLVYFIALISTPLLVGTSIKFEDYRTKSDKTVVFLNRIYFFMFLNTILIPISGQATFFKLAKNLSNKNAEELPSMFATNLMN